MAKPDNKSEPVSSPYRGGIDRTDELRNEFESIVIRTRKVVALTMHHVPNAAMLATLLYCDSSWSNSVGRWGFRIITMILVSVYQKRCMDMQKHFRSVLEKYKPRVVDKNFDNRAEAEFIANTELKPNQFQQEDWATVIAVFPILFELAGKATEDRDHTTLLAHAGVEAAIFAIFVASTFYGMKVRNEFNDAMKKIAKTVGPEVQETSDKTTDATGVRVDIAGKVSETAVVARDGAITEAPKKKVA